MLINTSGYSMKTSTVKKPYLKIGYHGVFNGHCLTGSVSLKHIFIDVTFYFPTGFIISRLLLRFSKIQRQHDFTLWWSATKNDEVHLYTKWHCSLAYQIPVENSFCIFNEVENNRLLIEEQLGNYVNPTKTYHKFCQRVPWSSDFWR